jgi:hypothetical protein
MIIGQIGRSSTPSSRARRWISAIRSSAVSRAAARARWTGSGSSPATTIGS